MEEQSFHPYYDDVDNAQWLFANVIEDTPVTIGYFVKTSENWNALLSSRIQNHFKNFGLGLLYAKQSGVLLGSIRKRLSDTFNKEGANGVKEYLIDEFQSRYEDRINSWQTAMYQAMANNDWFCNGGFNNK